MPAARSDCLRPAPLLGFASLQHIPAKRVHWPRVVPRLTKFRPQGLVTLSTVSAPLRLAGLVSSRQRSWDSPLRSFPHSQGGNRVSATTEPACRSPDAIFQRTSRQTGAPRCSFQALTLASVPGCQRGFSPWLAGCSLGVFPFQGSPASRLVRASARNSPHVLGCIAREQRLARTAGCQSATDSPDMLPQ